MVALGATLRNMSFRTRCVLGAWLGLGVYRIVSLRDAYRSTQGIYCDEKGRLCKKTIEELWWVDQLDEYAGLILYGLFTYSVLFPWALHDEVVRLEGLLCDKSPREINARLTVTQSALLRPKPEVTPASRDWLLDYVSTFKRSTDAD